VSTNTAHDAWMLATRNMELAAIQLAESISVQQYIDTDPTYMAQRGPVADAKRAEARVRFLANYRAAAIAADNARNEDEEQKQRVLRRPADVDERLREMEP